MKKNVRILWAIPSLLMICACIAGCAKDVRYTDYDSSGENFDYYLPDYVDVCDYIGIDVPDLTFTPTDADIDNYVMYTESLFCSATEDPDRPCQRGDIVDIITTCTFKDSGATYGYFNFSKKDTGSGMSFTLGSNYFAFPALDEAVEGMSQGETKTVTLTLPDPFYYDYMNSGREIEMEIYLNYIDEIDYNDATDDAYASFTGYSKEMYREAVKNKLTTDRNNLIEDYKSRLVWNYICEHSKLKKVPEKEYKEIYDAALNKARSDAKSKDLSLLEYVQSVGYDTLDDYYEYLEDFAENCCFEDMIMYYIIRVENLNYDDNYYYSAILERVADYQISDTEGAEEFLDYYYGIENVREDVRFQYAKDWLADHANVRKDINTVYSNKLNK